ncbi:molecular chaperone DnaK [Candidatus Dojkabacteria bacterium]|uniref:Chaperone protein DnaK n=1 Tax=Candidatus Dojkabacteria bacterium TaxID=2099670 RepID=A0A955L1K9_9BACT|nr:molecular chaperone DnaK [Candidatus Dojkabacteria bacterium]
MGKIIGIDLGTTNSAFAFVQAGKPEVITNKEGNRTTPSVVAIDVDSKSEIAGITAKNQMVTNPEQTFYSVKRFIGLKYDDASVKKDLELVPFKTRKSSKGGIEIQFGDKWVTPEEVSAKVLAKIKADAEAFLGESVDGAVITVPAYFDDSQRQATKNAGKIAGLDVKRIINEPTAAAIAYGLEKSGDQTIAVYDLGGGTFDVSILEIGDGIYEVKSTSGDTHLGGDDFDQRLIDNFVDEFKKEQGIDLKEDPAALQRLKEAAEKAKIALSSSEQTEVNLPYITADAKGPKHFRMTLKKADMEKLVSDLVDKTFDSVRQALKDAGVEKSEINEVVMVGGMTRMPMVKNKVKEFFGKEPNISVNPDEVVAVGAALQGAVLAGDKEVDDITLLDVTPLSLGLEVNAGQMHVLIPRNTTIPTEKSEDRFTTGVDNQPAIDVKVLQGERPLAKDNKVLGTFRLDGIPAAPRGVPQFEVTFKIDANGILNVKAKDKGTGKEQDITITASTQLDQEEIDKLVKEAEENASKDKEEMEKLKVRNDADSYVFQSEKLLKDHADKISEDQKTTLEDKNKEIKEELAKADDADLEKLKTLSNELMEKMQEVGAKVYEDAGGETQAEGESEDKPNAEEGEVVDQPGADKSEEGKTVE